MVSCEELYGGEELPLIQPDPVMLEIHRLQNQLSEKVKGLASCQSEIKALKSTEAKKDKAIEELRNEVNKLEERLQLAEDHLKHKNLEIKKLTEEKKDALAAQYAAEAALRRVHTDQKEDDFVPLESVISPLEAEIKIYRNEIAALQEDKKALERLTKSKESALLEAERILRSALERALIVEEVQNENFDLKRQIEICQEENKILEKTHRQKILEVEKLSQTIHELEEVILSSGANANAIRDYQRQISELQEEKRTLERELARVKVSANRIATIVANEWKDENDKVMPVRQWLEERKIMQAEMQRLKEKLAISERTAKAESQLKDKLKLRLKTLEEGLKNFSSNPINSNAGSAKAEKSNILSFLTNNGGLRNRSSSQPRASTVGSSFFQKPNIKSNIDSVAGNLKQDSIVKKKHGSAENVLKKGFLYDRLQKEVINLRKFCEIKDSSLHTKDEEIKMLTKKVDALTKAMEVEWKKMKREAAAREKEAASTKSDDNRKNRSSNPSRRLVKDY
ncbi:microtubule-associated protein 70-5-like isoform X2 [Abrus precatorius]|uniref:Microtubule-associated protein 70-5-like isoform X2 n=1 Tax=Abrus precatorius TaxID=3816 RepID=A0A8B8LVA3_ABRPR|nr:microtubule-associated protein 70-5-like isoform X2 [Abrus precatorius]